MNLQLIYPDTATFVLVQSGGYKGTKMPVDQEDVSVIFVQNTGFQNANNQEGVTSDAILYPDFTNSFIIANAHRLEGMYVLINEYSGDEDESWFKIESVTVNRDHLLNNQIDNIECQLKKTSPIAGVS